MDKNNTFMYKGAIHIHTNLSDGTGTLGSVVKAAKQNNLDWIIITDHNYYDTDEGIFGGIYVIKGEEISPQESDHYLALDINKFIEPNNNPQVFVNEVKKQGGFGFAAHPDEGIIVDDNGNCMSRNNSYHCIPWTNKNIEPDGIEIWNWFSNWADNLNDSNLYNLAYSYVNKHEIVKGPSKITLNWWDKMNNDRDYIVPAIGGVDAHALKYYKYIIPVTVFPYKTCLGTITNCLYMPNKLSDNFLEAKAQILQAIRQGNNIIVNRHTCKEIPKIFVKNSFGTYNCGENINLDGNCCLHFEANNIFDICLIYNGEEVEKYSSDKFIYPITKAGKYRLEVYFNGKEYLYTNPFNIKENVNINE